MAGRYATALFELALEGKAVDQVQGDLAVFDATGVDKGPIALAHLSHRVPAGFHGNWRPGSL